MIKPCVPGCQASDQREVIFCVALISLHKSGTNRQGCAHPFKSNEEANEDGITAADTAGGRLSATAAFSRPAASAPATLSRQEKSAPEVLRQKEDLQKSPREILPNFSTQFKL